MRSIALALLALALLGSWDARAGGAPRWLEDRLQAHLLERAPEGPVRISVPPLEGLELGDLAPESVEVSITSDAAEPFHGEVPLVISVRRGGEEIARAELTAEVASVAVGVVAARALERGTVLREGDMTLAPIEDPRERRSIVDAAGDAVGRRLRRRLDAGMPLRRAWLEDVPLVRRGEPVRLALVSGGLRIESTGVARQNGKAGEIVRVENTSSRREVIGRVGEDGVVHVAF
jgi:flagella basal body P-ring formation protein FlgA